MATSSIFHNVILRTPEQVEAFIRAAEASEADPYVKPEGRAYKNFGIKREEQENT